METWNKIYRLPECKSEIYSWQATEKGYQAKGAIVANCILPLVEFSVVYAVEGNTLTIETEYEIAERIQTLPRFGIEFGIAKKHESFSFVGFGKTESYVDKHVACDYGYYESTAKQNYESGYVRPQESGSHYLSKYLCVNDVFCLTAEKPFSFSVNPYTTKQLYETKHYFQLKDNDFVNVCIDLAMRGVGSHSCGPKLQEEYEIPKKGKNVFLFKFL
jgi:beta-galactosidase